MNYPSFLWKCCTALQWRHNGRDGSQITSLTIVYSIVYAGADQRKHQSSLSLTFVWGIHRWPVNSPHKRPVTRNMLPFDDVIMEHGTDTDTYCHNAQSPCPEPSHLCTLYTLSGRRASKSCIQGLSWCTILHWNGLQLGVWDYSYINYAATHFTLQWRHNGCDGVSHHQPHYCLLNRLFRPISEKTSKLRVTGLCVGNSPKTGEFPAQRASNADNVSIWWRHHDSLILLVLRPEYSGTNTQISWRLMPWWCKEAGHSPPWFWLFDTNTLLWRLNRHDGVSNHQLHDCLLSRLFRHR